MIQITNWITSMENIPEIIDKFCNLFQEMFSNRNFTGIGKRIDKNNLETTKPSFLLAIHYLHLEQITRVAPHSSLHRGR